MQKEIKQKTANKDMHFIEITQYKKIYKHVEEQQKIFNEWLAYLRQKLSLNPLKKKSASNIQTPYLPFCTSDNLPKITLQSSQKFIQFVQPFGHSQYRINRQFLEQIQNLKFRNHLTENSNQLKMILQQIQGIIKAIHHKIDKSVSNGNINKILLADLDDIAPNFAHNSNKKPKILTIDYYSERNWEKRYQRVTEILTEIQKIKKNQKQVAQNNIQKEVIELLNKLDIEVRKYRRKIMQYRNTLVNLYLNCSGTMMKGLREVIVIGQDIIGKFIKQFNIKEISERNNSEQQQEYENCLHIRNSQYIKSLQLLRNLYQVNNSIQKQFNHKKIQKILQKKYTQLNLYKLLMEGFDRFEIMKKNNIIRINKTIDKMEHPQLESYEDIIFKFLYQIQKNYQQLRQFIDKVQGESLESHDRSKSLSRMGLNNIWPHKQYLWLWNQFGQQNLAVYLLQKQQTHQDIQYLQRTAHHQKIITQQLIHKTLPKNSQFLQTQKCKLYEPITVSQCNLILDKIKIRILDKKSLNIIVPLEQIQTAQTSKSDKIKLILQNNLEIKVGGLKNNKNLIQNIQKKIKDRRNVLKNTNDNDLIEKQRQKIKDKNMDNNDDQMLELKMNKKSSSCRSEARITEKERQCIEKRKEKIGKQIQNVLEYQKFQEIQITGLKLRDVYKAIFTDNVPYFANHKYPTFFAHMANILGDKHFETTKYDKAGPKCITGNPKVTFQQCPISSQRTAKMVHPLPKIPFIPSTCQCNETDKIYWINNKQLMYLAQVRLSGAAMFQGVVTKTLYTVKQIQQNLIRIEIYGKFDIEGKNSFKSVMKKAGKTDMENVIGKISYQMQVSLDKYKITKNNIKNSVHRSKSQGSNSDSLTDNNQ